MTLHYGRLDALEDKAGNSPKEMWLLTLSPVGLPTGLLKQSSKTPGGKAGCDVSKRREATGSRVEPVDAPAKGLKRCGREVTETTSKPTSRDQEGEVVVPAGVSGETVRVVGAIRAFGKSWRRGWKA